MAQVLKTPLARLDLFDIYNYIAKDEDAQAVKILRLIDDKCRLLATFPEMGQAQPQFIIGLRSFPIKSYVIFYQPIADGIEVLRVLHGSRDIEEAFNQMIDDAESVN